MFALFLKFLHVVPGRKKKRPKLMSLGRTICLSGLLLRDKKLLFASVPFQCPWLWRMWRWMKGGAKDFWRVLLYADVMAGLAFGRWNPANCPLRYHTVMKGEGEKKKKGRASETIRNPYRDAVSNAAVRHSCAASHWEQTHESVVRFEHAGRWRKADCFHLRYYFICE